MGILLEGKDSPDSLTKDDNFINAKNRGGLYKVSAGVFEIFLVIEKFSRSNVSNQKGKVDVKQVVSSVIMDFSILSHFTALRNSASEESENEIYSTVR